MVTVHHPIETYPIHRVPATRPFIWLSQGWEDMLHHRAASMAYGAMVTVLGALILAYDRHPFYLAAITSAFLLVGPIFTAGLCELSRCRDHGEPANFQTSLQAVGRNRDNLLDFARTLLVIALTWFVLSGFFFYGATGNLAPALEITVWGDVMRHLSDAQFTAYVVIGGILAAVVFALSVVSVPLIVDRHVDARIAIRMSLRVAARDFPAMLVWGALIAGLVLIGFATALIGMLFIFPLLGHATWHAYRELVEQ
ncbi:MAG: DUF2189 domain-containing protein [Haliea sp.]|jgi:uncharacterized membrane protein|nr:DUF2189 domain-containing protein [Haliea sp.]